MASVFEHPDLAQFSTELFPGQTVHFENFTTTDIFILIKGSMEVYLSEKLITVATEPGTVLLDIVKLLDNYNSVGIKSLTTTEVMRISADDIQPLIEKHPEFAKIISKSLVTKITEPQSMVYDCNTFSDQLPDAVVVVDHAEVILSINEAAENLFGYIKDELEMQPVSKIFPLVSDYQAIVDQISPDTSLREQIISANHPSKGKIYISISIANLTDRNDNRFGYILICRDITKAKRVDSKYTYSKKALIPLLILILMGAIVFAIVLPQAFKGYEVFDARKDTFQEQISQDLKALLKISNPVLKGTRTVDEALSLISSYFSVVLPHHKNYSGLVILDSKKKVVYMKSLDEKTRVSMAIGSSYGEFQFDTVKDSIHGVISSYHVNKDNPQGERYTEVVFPVHDGNKLQGWFVFIMDMEHLNKVLNLQEEDLKAMKIRG